MLRIAVCDDEEYICDMIERCIRTALGEERKTYIQCYSSGEELIGDMENGSRYDLIYLDYEMDGMDGCRTGLTIRKKWKDWSCLIIYVSGHADKIFQLLEVSVFQFIKKPIDEGRFKRILYQAVERIENSGDKLVVKKGREAVSLKMSEIIYLESMKRQVYIAMEGDGVSVYDKLDALEEKLVTGNGTFVRIHQSFVINLDFVTRFYASKVVMEGGRELEISRKYRSVYEARCEAYMRKQCL